MTRPATPARKAINSAIAWTIAAILFFPILLIVLTGFKTEAQAIASPPTWLFFEWTLENYREVQ